MMVDWACKISSINQSGVSAEGRQNNLLFVNATFLTVNSERQNIVPHSAVG